MEDRLARRSSWRPAVRQILCAHLRQWPIDRFRRKRRLSLNVGCASAHHPLVLVKNVATRQVIMAASREAQAHGICIEMTLAEACALCPNLEHGEYQPREDRKGLMGLARWMMRFSPVVALDPSDDPEADPTPAIFMDVGGCERLYGSLSLLMEQLDEAIRRLRLHVTLAIAPTVGAAFALAISGRHLVCHGRVGCDGANARLTQPWHKAESIEIGRASCRER